MLKLKTADDVVAALGGTKQVALRVGRQESAVSNWRTAGKFPAHTYRLLKDDLEALGHAAPDSLWVMTKPKAVSP